MQACVIAGQPPMSLARRLVADWYAPRLTVLTAVLSPLSLVFAAAVVARRGLYRARVLRSHRLRAAVVIVGNIAVGGTGKTPLALAIADGLAARGWRPGIVSRGHGGSSGGPRRVDAASDPGEVGDEPVLLARSGWPVWIGRDRVAAGRALLAQYPECNVVIADDGLQHYALARNAEICAVDASRGCGNGWLLPAGPLREPPARLAEVDAVVRLAQSTARISPREFETHLAASRFVRVNRISVTSDASAFRGPGVHALAGIGTPARFFAQLRELGISPTVHEYPDHHQYTPRDLEFPGATSILMTEKDAVKCAAFADDRCWALPVTAIVDPSLITLVEEKLRGFKAA